MQIRDVMTQNVEVVDPKSPVSDAAAMMKTLDAGSLPVCEQGKLVGMITDRDIAMRVVADGRDPRETPVSDAMTEEVVYCFEYEDVQVAAQIMGQKQIRRLPILNPDKQLVGIVSLGDLAVNTNKDKLIGKVLEGVSEPPRD